MNIDHLTCACACGARQFHLRLLRSEQVGLVTCDNGHHSLLLDSRDYWIDLLQDGRPKQSRCRCGGTLFGVELAYEFREGGDVRSIEVSATCAVCHREQSPLLFEINYGPTTELVSKPLDPIDDPWLRPRRRQITAYWKPADAERFANHLVESQSARVFMQRKYEDIEEYPIGRVIFHPELEHDLLFTNLPEIVPTRVRDPQKSAPFLRLSSPTNMVLSWPSSGLPSYPDGIGLLHYIEYSEEIAHQAGLKKQPKAFIEFARQACQWLRENYVSNRGKNTADNPDELARFARTRR